MIIRLTRARPVLVAVQPRRLSPISHSSLVPKTLRYGRGIIYWVISSTNQLSNYSPLQLGVWCISSPQDLGHDALWHFVSHKQAAALWLNIGGVNLWMRSVFRQMNVSMHSHPACSELCYSFTEQRLSIGVNVALKSPQTSENANRLSSELWECLWCAGDVLNRKPFSMFWPIYFIQITSSFILWRPDQNVWRNLNSEQTTSESALVFMFMPQCFLCAVCKIWPEFQFKQHLCTVMSTEVTVRCTTKGW